MNSYSEWLKNKTIYGPERSGLPTGGTVGQVPIKASATDFDTAWGNSNTLLPNVSQIAAYRAALFHPGM